MMLARPCRADVATAMPPRTQEPAPTLMRRWPGPVPMPAGSRARHGPDVERAARPASLRRVEDTAMKPITRLIRPALLGAALCLLAAAPASAAPPELRPIPRLCPAVGPCALYPRRLVIPAEALGRQGSITPTVRGLSWTGGTASFVIPRPLDYRGGPVRVVLFHYIPIDDEGTVGYSLTPVSLRAGSGYETYGGNVTSLVPANSDTHYEQWARLAPEGGGFSGAGAWWSVEIQRIGTFTGRNVLLTVLVEYD